MTRTYKENKIVREELVKTVNSPLHYWNDKHKHARRKVFKPAYSLYSLQYDHDSKDIVDRSDMDTVLTNLKSRGVDGWEKCFSRYNKNVCIGIKKYEEL